MTYRNKYNFLLMAVLAGCASSGVIPAGPDTYIVSGQSATGFHSGASVTADLYREANAYCAGIKKQFLPISVNSRDGVPGRAFANSELQFRCLAAGDPDLHRPTMAPVPNVRIEQVK